MLYCYVFLLLNVCVVYEEWFKFFDFVFRLVFGCGVVFVLEVFYYNDCLYFVVVYKFLEIYYSCMKGRLCYYEMVV